MRKRLRRSVKAVTQWCQQHRHKPGRGPSRGAQCQASGSLPVYGRPTNYRSLRQFYRLVRRLWHKWLNRRTRGKTLPWRAFVHLLDLHPLVRPASVVPARPLNGESCVKNRVRQSRTLGSVRGTLASYGAPTRARSWKRWIRPRESYGRAVSPTRKPSGRKTSAALKRGKVERFGCFVVRRTFGSRPPRGRLGKTKAGSVSTAANARRSTARRPGIIL